MIFEGFSDEKFTNVVNHKVVDSWNLHDVFLDLEVFDSRQQAAHSAAFIVSCALALIGIC